jgi:aryl-alcohol dehydrogenase-like predicted oxidoreductase
LSTITAIVNAITRTGSATHYCQETIAIGYGNTLIWKALSSAAQARGVSRGSLVLAWLMSGVPPLIPLVAASTVEQLRENIDARKIVLDAACLRDLTQAAG